MNPAFISTASLFAASALTGVLAAVSSTWLRRLLRRRWKVLLVLLSISFLVKFPFGDHLYHGMEYEDCYVHQAVARQLEIGKRPVIGVNPYRETIHSIGSFEEGDYHQSFYHYIGYPAVIRVLQLFSGDSPRAGHMVSFLSSWLSTLLVFILAARIRPRSWLPVAAAVTFASLPLANSHAGTTGAEVFSSFYVTAAVLLLYSVGASESGSLARPLRYLALSLVLLFALLVKRENVLLLPLVPLLLFLCPSEDSRRRWMHPADVIRHSAIILLCPVLFMLLQLDLPTSYAEEAAVVAAPVFSIAHVASLAPAFLQSLASPKHYLAFGILLIFMPLAWQRLPRSRPMIAVLVGYVILYVSHWRSYYHLQGQPAIPEDFSRYVMNIAPLLATTSAVGLLSAMPRRWVEFADRNARRAAIVGTGLVITLSALLSARMRFELTEIEQRRRIRPALTAMATLREQHAGDFWLFTFEPCVLQIYGPRWLQTADLALVDEYDPALLTRIVGGSNAYAMFLPEHVTGENARRFAGQISWIELSSESTIMTIERWSVVRLAQGGRAEDSSRS